MEEPVLGWTETISAMGGLMFAGMLGLINYLYVKKEQILDLVPVDYVSNAIIVATAYCGRFGVSGQPLVVHSSSSQLNPISIWEILTILLRYNSKNPSSRQVKDPWVICASNKIVYDSLFYLTQALPLRILQSVSTLPVVGSKKIEV